VVSLVASLVLYFVAVGNVKGFAFTLGLTTVFDVVIAFLVTAPLVILVSRREAFANPKLNGLHSAFRAADRRQARDEASRAAVSGESEPAESAAETDTPPGDADADVPTTGEEK
jgi:preprotein translocase subunit SecD